MDVKLLLLISQAIAFVGMNQWDERVHYYLYLFNQLKYLYLYLCSEWTGLNLELGRTE